MEKGLAVLFWSERAWRATSGPSVANLIDTHSLNMFRLLRRFFWRVVFFVARLRTKERWESGHLYLYLSQQHQCRLKSIKRSDLLY